MMKNKIKTLIFLLVQIVFVQSSLAVTLNELNYPKEPASRMGISNSPESKYFEVKTKQNDDFEVIQSQIGDNGYEQTYADLSLKRLADDVSYDLNIEQDKLLSDLQVLWAAAANRSETIKYTIYKLSNPDENKPDDSLIKKIIRPIANISTIAGSAIGSNPFVASGALIGGGLINAFTKDDKEINYKFTKVSDADMVVLVRKIDDLQKKLLNLYVDYSSKKEIAEMTSKNLENRKEIYEKSQNKSREEIIIADVYYRNAQNAAKKAQAEYWAARTILENLVGTNALNEIEKDDSAAI